MRKWHEYLEELDEEIDELIEEEADGLDPEREELLHFLFENRKHALECLREMTLKHSGEAAKV